MRRKTYTPLGLDGREEYFYYQHKSGKYFKLSTIYTTKEQIKAKLGVMASKNSFKELPVAPQMPQVVQRLPLGRHARPTSWPARTPHVMAGTHTARHGMPQNVDMSPCPRSPFAMP